MCDKKFVNQSHPVENTNITTKADGEAALERMCRRENRTRPFSPPKKKGFARVEKLCLARLYSATSGAAAWLAVGVGGVVETI